MEMTLAHLKTKTGNSLRVCRTDMRQTLFYPSTKLFEPLEDSNDTSLPAFVTRPQL